jgi:hypothetical protein
MNEVINILVEGVIDEAVANRLLDATEHTPGVCYGKQGCGYIKKKIQGFNRAAKNIYILALLDFMDTKLSCPPEVISKWAPHLEPKMIFRIVVRELESWLLADRHNLSNFLKVNVSLVPLDPESITDPKRALINLARHSKSARIRSAFVPEANSTAQVGKLYTSEIISFIEKSWDVQAARHLAPSLDRCLKRLEEL